MRRTILIPLISVLLVFSLLAIFTSFRAPLGMGPDEAAHFMFARFFEQQGYLPLTREDRLSAGFKSDQPPLNAIMVALAFFQDGMKDPPFVKLTHDVPRRHLVTGPDSVTGWQVINTQDPIVGEILLWRTGRILSVLFSTLTLVVIYVLALLLFEDHPQQQAMALATVSGLAFVPTFVFISAVFSYENLLGLWLSLYLLTALYIIKKRREGRGWYLLAGLLVGLAMVTKLSALPALLSLAGVILVAAYRMNWSKPKLLGRFVLAGLGVFVAAGWWFGLMIWRLNRVAEMGWLAGLIHPIIVADGSDTTSQKLVGVLSGNQIEILIGESYHLNVLDWLERLFRTLWRLQWQGQNQIFLMMAVITLLILIGLGRIWWRQPSSRLWLALLVGQILLFAIFPTIRFLVTQEAITGQGQHLLFPAAGAFAILITWGLSAWLPVRWGWVGGLLLGGVLLIWSIFQAIWLYQPPLPVQTVLSDLPPLAKAAEMDFGSIRLLGYELHGLVDESVCCDPLNSVLGVHLFWRAEELSVEDYLTEVSLINSQNQVTSGWIGHPVNGRYPTRAWESGDTVQDELWLPVKGLPAGEYTLKLRLVDHQSEPVTEQFVLTTIILSGSATEYDPNPFVIWGQGQVSSGMPSFESRSTIQITAQNKISLTLLGPDGVVREAIGVLGNSHLFVVGLLWPPGEYALRLEAGSQPVWETPPILLAQGEGRNVEIPTSQVPLEANFANQLRLLGYTLPQTRLKPGDSLPVMLNIQALQTMPADFIMFTRLLDETGSAWGGYDRRPKEVYSTLLWAEGEVVADGFTINVDPNTPDGVYYLDIGFYLPVGEAAVSLPLVQNGQLSDVTNVSIGPVMIKSVP